MPKKVYNLIILDESGSMAAIKQPTILGFNELIQTINNSVEKHPELEQWILFYSFNSSGIKELISLQKVHAIHELKDEKYRPEAMTPLYDAIGHSINRLRYLIEKETEQRVLVTILTDGAENASKEFTSATIKNMVTQLEAQGWTFIYMGANQDVNKVAASMNINHQRSWISSDLGVHNMMELERNARIKYYHKIAENKFNKADKYFEEDTQNPN